MSLSDSMTVLFARRQAGNLRINALDDIETQVSSMNLMVLQKVERTSLVIWWWVYVRYTNMTNGALSHVQMIYHSRLHADMKSCTVQMW